VIRRWSRSSTPSPVGCSAADPLVGIWIRRATADDVPALARIAEAAYAPYVVRMGQKPASMVADFAAHVAADAAYVAEAAAAAVGYIVTFEKDAGQFIENVAVHPDRQGEGIGRALLYFAEQEAEDNRLARLFLYINVHMTENLDFYPRLGYVESHRVCEAGFDCVCFEKRITYER